MNLLHLLHALLLAASLKTALASVLAIDYGTDWIKASLMKPGLPFDVLLNKDSKRKIQTSVAWKQGDRLFSTDAFNLASRFPTESFSSTKLLLAAPYNSDAVSYFRSISPASVIETDRKTVGLVRGDGEEWSIEELTAMHLSYIKSLAETMAEEKVYDVIITVPSYYSQFERDAIADAIEIAGLRTLAIINDGTAVAVNYAMTRSFSETPEHHVIFDAGASSIRATVVSITAPGDKSTTQITVEGVGYDKAAGGTELDRRMREILIEKFNAKTGRDIRTDKRGMAKLWKEAGRVKAILSANTDAVSQVESLAWDVDFKTKVTRAEFEEACKDLQAHFAMPIIEAVKNAGLAMSDVTSVIFHGGSTRTPMIQNAVKQTVGADKIALNVNADEAAVLGAGLYGAGLSRQFKTKDIKINDISIHDVSASYFAAPTTEHGKPRSITSSIFPAGSKTGTKKTMTFKRKEDFDIFLDYKKAPGSGFPTRILETEITGVEEAIKNLTEKGASDPVVKATLSLSESGFISVSEAVAYGEVTITGKLKQFFGGSNGGEEGVSESQDEPIDVEKSSTEEEEVVERKDPSTIKLGINNKFVTLAPMTVDEKKFSRARLRALDAEEAAKTRKEEARNTLESYLYRLRDLIDDDTRDSPFMKCSQVTERKAIADKLEETISWMYDNGDAADTTALLDKRSTLESLERPIIHRYQEIEAFPQALNNSQMWNWSTRLFITEARQTLAELEEDQPAKWTSEEIDALEKTLKDHESWLNIYVEKQKGVKPNEDPAIETTEMKARAKVLEQHLQKLVKRKVPKKKTTTTSSTAAESTPSEAADETPTQEVPVENGDGQIPLKGPEHVSDEL